MKSIIIKAGAAIALGLITGTSAASASTTSSDMSSGSETTMRKVEHGSAHVAKATVRESRMIAHTTVRDSKGFAISAWDESKRVGRTIVDSPVIAYEVVRGERPLFRHETVSRGQSRREQIALTGHHRQMSEASHHNEPPPI